MSFITDLLRKTDEHQSAPVPEFIRVSEPAAPVERSTIGNLASAMATTHAKYSERERHLSAEIDRLTEERRQARVALAAVRAAMEVVRHDEALTDDERERANVAAEPRTYLDEIDV